MRTVILSMAAALLLSGCGDAPPEEPAAKAPVVVAEADSKTLADVKYEIRGQLANRALELEKRGYEVISLNIGNPGLFGFRTPETMRLAMIENLAQAEPYCHQKGIFPAREAVVMQQQDRGISGVSAEEVFIGNGVSELIDLSLRALLNPGDEVLVPSPDYPLWSAAVALNGGKPTYYDCPPERAFVPDPDAIESLIGARTRAIVVINPPQRFVFGRLTPQSPTRSCRPASDRFGGFGPFQRQGACRLKSRRRGEGS